MLPIHRSYKRYLTSSFINTIKRSPFLDNQLFNVYADKRSNQPDSRERKCKNSGPPKVENEISKTLKELKRFLENIEVPTVSRKPKNAQNSDNPKHEDNKNGDEKKRPDFLKILTKSVIILCVLGLFLELSFTSFPTLTFEKFKTEVLSRNNLARIKVHDDHTLLVITKDDKLYNLHMVSIDNFMKKLESSCEELALNIDDIPFVYTSDKNRSPGQVIYRWFWSTLPIFGLLFLVNVFNPRRLMADFKKIESSLMGVVGGGRAQFSPVNAKHCQVRFKDIKGCDDAKNEIIEFVEFLKNPDSFIKMGAKIPKGAVLYGPPGTGKTLLAKAVAGEANVPLLYASGSEFVEMFVGLGAKRMRQLFNKAKEFSPCIVFIDEIDAVGSSRSRLSSHSEHDQTLNQLLCELDGFNTDTNVVLLCGTNQFEKLDKALIRPGRLDRKIYLAPPDIKGRIELFELYLSQIKIDQNVCHSYSQRLAGLTPGTTGADIAVICNEAAILASRSNADFVNLEHLEQSIDRLVMGNRISKRLNDKEKRNVSIHESGHAVVSWFLKNTFPLLKISIVPRGNALGVNQFLPTEDHLYSADMLFDMMTVLLGGRAAEEILVGSISTGAQDDLQKVTKLAYQKVGTFGMDSEIGLVAFPSIDRSFSSSMSNSPYSSKKEYGEELANKIDKRVQQLVEKAYTHAKDIVIEKKHLLLKLSDELYIKEILSNAEIEAILGSRPEGSITLSQVLNDAQRPILPTVST